MELFISGRQTHGLQNLGLHLTDMCLYVTSSAINSHFLKHFLHWSTILLSKGVSKLLHIIDFLLL